MPELAREVVAAAAGQHAEHAPPSAQLAGDRADEPVAAHRRGDLARRGRGARQLAGVLERRPCCSTRKATPGSRSAASTAGSSRAARPAPALGLTIRLTARVGIGARSASSRDQREALGAQPLRHLLGAVGDHVGVDHRPVRVDRDRRGRSPPGAPWRSVRPGARSPSAASTRPPWPRDAPPRGRPGGRAAGGSPCSSCACGASGGGAGASSPAPAGQRLGDVRGRGSPPSAVGRAGRGAREHERGVHPGAPRARDVDLEPVADGERAPGPSRSRAASYIGGSGLPTIRSAGRPAAVSTAASTAPVPGHGPSGIGKVGSRLAPISSAPRSTAWVAIRSST